jgi:hypothetical protein
MEERLEQILRSSFTRKAYCRPKASVYEDVKICICICVYKVCGSKMLPNNLIWTIVVHLLEIFHLEGGHVVVR